MSEQTIQEVLASRAAAVRELKVSDEQARSAMFAAARDGGGASRIRRSRRLRLTAAVATSAAALGTVAIVAGSGDVTSSAFAVQSRPDGTVTVAIHQLHDAAGLRGSLQDAGIPAVVDYSPAHKPACAFVSNAMEQLRGKRRGELGAGIAGAAQVLRPQRHSAAPAGKQGAARRRALKGTAHELVLLLQASQRNANTTAYSVDPDQIKKGESLYIATAAGTVDSVGMAISQRGDPAGRCAAQSVFRPLKR